jgi:hypothetical protein
LVVVMGVWSVAEVLRKPGYFCFSSGFAPSEIE